MNVKNEVSQRPILDKNLDSKVFRDYYYLKQELIDFCRKNHLPISGGKIEITERIVHFLDTGEILPASNQKKQTTSLFDINKNTKIESPFVCSQKHRVFFRESIGSSFSFNVAFQKWLKNNAGKTYWEAITAYYRILKRKKQKKPEIDKQFEYNIYIRDFFADNQGKSLKEAIKCWRYKKSLQGHNRYERSDLVVLESPTACVD
uniref:DUF6434 domain-containing protein n=1 Tax=uncultured Helicobacter sp. TaxID=175537 RepID=A0A650EK40_9HELI|nr:hypothetical protein Helico4rc_2400 [uncultured Helicobacter sp.]